jgi:hypothetical protein
MHDKPKEPKPEESPKRPVGRPPLKMPDLIPDTPENIAWAVLNTKPKKRGVWRFERKDEAQP